MGGVILKIVWEAVMDWQQELNSWKEDGCFELLKLPNKLMMTGKSKKRMRCGSCSAIIQFELGSKEFGAFVQVKQLSAEFAPGTSDLPNENLQSANSCLVNNDMSPWFDDYDNFSYHFNDAKLESPSRSQNSNSTELDKRYSGHSSPSSLSEDELIPENTLVRHDLTHRAELPLEGDPITLLDSSQNDHAYTISPKDVVEKK
ncbi:hypothetical protein T459_09295 [Capsicum annuum]|uniref:Probable zinc-ribbon domain-containing protein n=1 Tax=Capsicum annuum TaxID=4072 RepID=A0A2G2ZYY6_CAPAN|nr:hypothetical protein FXO37_26754 [Capsicum annuum]PHT87189.1 hypothetical protein T459_09295 [Capsicum annuum]